MAGLEDIHLIVYEKLEKQFSFTPVTLKHHLPERSMRALGLVKIDGKVLSSEEFLRVLILTVNVALLREVRTVFLGPRIALDLPVFSSETILMGKKRMFFLDVQRRGGYGRHDDSALYDRLVAIRGKYPDLFASPLRMGREIDKTFSKAYCYVSIAKEQDAQALELLHAYLDVYLEMVRKTQPLTGDRLAMARQDHETYARTVIDHDPAAKVYRVLFGKRGGVERIKELFFAA